MYALFMGYKSKVFEFADTVLIVFIYFSRKCKHRYQTRPFLSSCRFINGNVKLRGIIFKNESEKV